MHYSHGGALAFICAVPLSLRAFVDKRPASLWSPGLDSSLGSQPLPCLPLPLVHQLHRRGLRGLFALESALSIASVFLRPPDKHDRRSPAACMSTLPLLIHFLLLRLIYSAEALLVRPRHNTHVCFSFSSLAPLHLTIACLWMLLIVKSSFRSSVKSSFRSSVYRVSPVSSVGKHGIVLYVLV